MPPIDKNRLAHTIRSLEGLTTEDKSALLELLSTRKKYGLVWEDKPEAVEEELRTKLPVLTEVVEHRIVGTGENPPNHILIEGDNLHALTALQYTHEGKVDVIYIDPPYNTGNKDFIYNDHYVDKEDQWRHSKWLSFMARRLKLAKALLKESGVLFISLDDNEQAQMKLLCDEVLREDNFVTNIIVQSNKRGQTYKDIAKTHEYVLVYTKNPTTSLKPVDKEDNGFSFSDKVGEFSIRELRNRNPKFGRFNRPNLYYPFYVSDKVFDSNGLHLVSLTPSDDFPISTYPLNSEGLESCWRWSKALVNKSNTGRISDTPVVARKKRDGGWNIYEKYRKTTERVKSIWVETEVINEQGSVELKDIGINGFDHPKPVYLISKCLSIGSHSDSVVLDFFAGSGTTLHAVIALNAEDGGSRQCILVTNNENKICEEVTLERGKRIIQGYKDLKGASVEGLAENTLRYFKTDFVEREPSIKNRRELTQAARGLLCLKEDCFERIEFPNSLSIEVFEGAETVLLLILEPEEIPKAIELIRTQNKHCKVYVFSPGAYAWDEEFDEVAGKITLCALPEAILQAYRRVLPPVGPSVVYEETDEGGSE